MKIGVSMITRDEREYIARAVNSVGFADYLAIQDFSVDDTLSVARENLPDGVVMYSDTAEWPDHFGDARQMSFELLPEDTGWWIRLDADEVFSEQIVYGIRDMLETVDPGLFDAIKIRQTNLVENEHLYSSKRGGFETHPRIFRYQNSREQHTVWTGNIHEWVQVMSRDGLNPIPAYRVGTWNVQVFHLGWLDRKRRLERGAQYVQMEGSGFVTATELADRDHVIRVLPLEVPSYD